MKYYLLSKFDKEEDAVEIGEKSFSVFYTSDGFHLLTNLIGKYNLTTELEMMKIINDKGEELTVEEFLDDIVKLQIRSK